ncbi:hypothetical protein MRB53_027917 [Persea americana]|uniref:Uncharacterized protein n=1 Tax=Persea americana TaxID=3435 RepID=A0ACC2KE50_PERAE|nr:hypothetical protein MRB53_027917 [Persea americana]
MDLRFLVADKLQCASMETLASDVLGLDGVEKRGDIARRVGADGMLGILVRSRTPPPHPYNNSWAALQWIAAWLMKHGDFSNLMVAGDSIDANIAHQMAMRANVSDLSICSVVLIHPFFWGVEPKEPARMGMVESVWKFACPSLSDCDDPEKGQNM